MGNPLPGGAVVVPMPTKPPAIAKPQPARRGELGTCELCNEPAISHWDTAGRFVGCVAASDDTVFVLKAVSVTTDTARPRRARWFPELPPEADVDAMGLSPQRGQVLRALQDVGIEGALSSEICERTGLKNSSVQMALAWLRDHKVVRQADAKKQTR